MLVPFPVAGKKYSHKINLGLQFQWYAVHKDRGDLKSEEGMITEGGSLITLQLQAGSREQTVLG